eukprot:CAMPEP_0170171704 /NCGR_PEP_ID=MMETSP0040_2-20121228/4872_1 /TAXON_ID=641309 /ORGANISM="Lotharella oceanica, Strain CCMP622" /LENGTH=279 /DNA_ID=CAMNT_0010411917 /DNA_START=16 /DNA_END=855 /DNA_ORIENTATION=+
MNSQDLISFAKLGELDCVNEIIAAGANLEHRDEKDQYGSTALIAGAEHGHLAVVQRLVNVKAQVNTKDTKDGGTAIYWAACKGHFSVVKWLAMEGKASVDIGNNNGSTPLFISAQTGHIDVVKFLVNQAKAHVDAALKTGATPLVIASEKGILETVRWLVTEGRANVSTTLKSGHTALTIAASFGQLDVVKYLIGVNASIMAETPDGNAIETALKYHKTKVAKWLAGENIKAANKALNRDMGFLHMLHPSIGEAMTYEIPEDKFPKKNHAETKTDAQTQ